MKEIEEEAKIVEKIFINSCSKGLDFYFKKLARHVIEEKIKFAIEKLDKLEFKGQLDAVTAIEVNRVIDAEIKDLNLRLTEIREK